jgi:hypothetical protein
MQSAMQKLHGGDKPVAPKAEAPKAEARKPEPKKAEPKKVEPKEEKAGLLKGLFKGLTGSKK